MLYFFGFFTTCPSHIGLLFLVYSGELVPGHIHRYSLENLSPGNYDIYMEANTDAGSGAAGQIANFYIGEEGTHTHRLTAIQTDT